MSAPSHDQPAVSPEEVLFFQQEALAVLAELCPDRRIAPGDDPWSVRVDALHVGLHNSLVESRRQRIDAAGLRDFLRLRFAALLVDGEVGGEDSIDEVRSRLLPQFMPANYVRVAPLVSFPFHEDLDIGLVIDGARTYRYVKRGDLDRWRDWTEAAALEQAVTNLATRSRNLPIHFSGEGPEQFVALETRDGFDAARILLPEFQQYVADRLGDPFGFAIPNRDFLICWSRKNSAAFRAHLAAKVAQDSREQAYSLSPALFRWHEGRIFKD